MCANSKRNVRKLDRKYRITKCIDNWLMFTVARNTAFFTRSTYNKYCIFNCNHNLKDMFIIYNKFLGRKLVKSILTFSLLNISLTSLQLRLRILLILFNVQPKIDFNDSLFHSFDPSSIDMIIRLINSTKSVYIDDK